MHRRLSEPAVAACSGRILVVDDDRRMASRRAEWLCSLGWHASAAGSAAEALRLPGLDRAAGCLVDALLPDDGGRRVADAIRAAAPEAAIVALTATGAIPPAWADAAVVEPGRDDEILAAIGAAREAAAARGSARACSLVRRGGLVGCHPVFQTVLELADRVARTPATVLVTGESGTGKSLLARRIHAASGRSGRFIEVACGSLAEPLLESELFGHVAGAFTGATADRPGKFGLADGGTIFLDEIATASPALQVKLLRVLQELEFEPVGGGETQRVDVRVVLATNEDLATLVAQGRFRADLFWRVNVITLELPPLRDRAADIMPLAWHFLREAATKAGRDVHGFTPAAHEALERHPWPGNVRELEHAVARAVFLGRGSEVDAADLPASVLAGDCPAAGPGRLKAALAAPERELILAALERSGWRRDVAARSLGINRTTLYKKLKRLGLDVADLQPVRWPAGPG
jgi:DNA-binding NtrC family response regulator